MTSDSLEKASWWGSFRAFTAGLPLFFLQWGHSLGMSSMSAISSSSCLGMGTPWSEEWCKHFAPACGAGIFDILGMEDAGAGPLSAMVLSWAVADIPRMVASSTSPVRSHRGYRSIPQVSGRQPHMATPKVSTKAWWSHPSSAFASHSSTNTLLLWACWKAQAVVAQCNLACLWPKWPVHCSGTPPALHLSPALCSRNPWWPCLWVVTLGPCSFSPVAEVAHLTVWLVQSWVAWGCQTKELLANSSVFGMVGWGSGWVMWVKLGVPPGVATRRDICMRAAIGTGMTESIPSGLKGSSVTLAEGRLPRATQGSSLLGILFWETGAEDAGEACCSHSKAPLSCR